MLPYTESTYRRHDLIRRYYAQLRPHLPAPHRFLAVLMKSFAPSTALSYAVTAVSLIPELKEDPGTPPAILYLKKAMARRKQNQATPVTVTQMRSILRHASRQVAATLRLMWLQLARHGDLIHGRLQAIQRTLSPQIRFASVLQ